MNMFTFVFIERLGTLPRRHLQVIYLDYYQIFKNPPCLLMAGSTQTRFYPTIYGRKPFLKDLQNAAPGFEEFCAAISQSWCWSAESALFCKLLLGDFRAFKVDHFCLLSLSVARMYLFKCQHDASCRLLFTSWFSNALKSQCCKTTKIDASACRRRIHSSSF